MQSLVFLSTTATFQETHNLFHFCEIKKMMISLIDILILNLFPRISTDNKGVIDT